mmetsp:Transcript_27607/g.41348  ORF Transcript_27607/g.41348 Transcript_27607/m.41348 type:complete len:83 (-) Transcript_27607:1353-1601(-)
MYVHIDKADKRYHHNNIISSQFQLERLSSALKASHSLYVRACGTFVFSNEGTFVHVVRNEARIVRVLIGSRKEFRVCLGWDF